MTNPLRGQFEVELPDGTTVPCLLNMHALGLWCREGKHKLTDLDKLLQEQPLEALPDLTWAGVRTHYLLEGKEPTLDEGRFRVLLGSSDYAVLAEHIAQALNIDDGQKTKKKRVPRSR